MSFGLNLDNSTRVEISRRCQGIYVRWWYNGWHYWLFKDGQVMYQTEGEKYRTLGRRAMRIGSTQLNYQQVAAIRTLQNTREIYAYTDRGWRSVRVEHNEIEVKNNTTDGYDLEMTIILGSRNISADGFSPAILIPTVPPSIEYCELDIAIASQIWMCKNWDAAIPGSVVYDDDEANRAIYGGLYTYNQAMTPGFCPDGYKVPSLDEWRTLITAMGGSLVAGGELKEAGTDHWLTPNSGAVDTYSFAALPGGNKNRWTGVYENLNQTAFFWTSTPASGSNAYAVYMTSDSASIVEVSAVMDYHFSLRLIKSVYVPPSIFNAKYGLLYNRYAAIDARNIASEGWHVPTKDEFTTLVNYLIAAGYGYGGEGDRIAKSVASNLFWDTSIVLGSPGLDPAENNSSGFNLPPAGGRDSHGSFNPVTMRPAGKGAGIWTSTEFPTSVAFYFEIVYNDVYFHSVINSKKCGLSIRPIKDSTTLTHGQTGTYTGNDGKTYRTICIGTQEWLADNLCETKFRTGEAIPEVTNNAAWAALETAGMCAYDNDWSNV